MFCPIFKCLDIIWVLKTFSVEGVCGGLPSGPITVSLQIDEYLDRACPLYIFWNSVSHLVIEEIDTCLQNPAAQC